MSIVTPEWFYKFLESVKSGLCELYISALDHVMKLKLSSILHLTSINSVSVLSCPSDSAQGSYFQAQALYLSLRTSYM